MREPITLRQYRNIDLGILAAILAVTQAIIPIAASRIFPDQLYVVSPTAAMVTLVMMRWSPWAAIHAVLGGAVYCWASGGAWQHYLIYCVGNLFSMVGLLYIKAFGKEKIRSDSFLSVTLAVLVQIAMLLGRGILAMLLGNGVGAAVGFAATDALSILFTGLVIWAARRVDGLFEDQKHYLLRTQAEQMHERREQI